MSSSAQWSLHPLLHGNLPKEALTSFFEDIFFVRYALVVVITLMLMYPITHHSLLKMSKEYKVLGSTKKQIIATHHVLESLVISATLPVLTYHCVRAFFRESNDLDESLLDYSRLTTISMNYVFMYAFEIASRFEEPSSFVMIHHSTVLVYLTICSFITTSILWKVALILIYNVSFEAVTFYGLVMYRLFPTSPYTPKVIALGMFVFGITRPLQLLMLSGACFGSWNDENVSKWQIIFAFFVSLFFTTIQLYTVKIHYSLWKRCIGRQKKAGSGPSDGTSSNGDENKKIVEKESSEKIDSGSSDLEEGSANGSTNDAK